jgi:virginiamycin B lyase
VGAVTQLKADPALQPSLCQLTPDLRETDVQPAVGGNPGSHPQGLAPDPSGNIWFTDDGPTPAIGRFELATGKITEISDGLPPGSAPRWIAPDRQGKIWFTDDGTTPAIGRLDPKTNKITEFTKGLAAGSVPWAIVFNPVDHRLWFTDHSTNNPAIGSLDPKNGTIHEYAKGLNVSSHPEGIEVDKSGDLWFTDDSDHRPALGTADHATHAIHEYSKGLVEGSLPRGIAVGPDGNLWFADERTSPPHNSAPNAPGDGLIGRINRLTKAIDEFSIAQNGGNSDSIPEGLASANGRIWFTDDGATKAIGAVDPATGAMAETTTSLAANSQPVGIVVTKSGLWFTDQLPTPRIGRIKALPSC